MEEPSSQPTQPKNHAGTKSLVSEDHHTSQNQVDTEIIAQRTENSDIPSIENPPEVSTGEEHPQFATDAVPATDAINTEVASLPVLPHSSMRERSRKDSPLICHIVGCKINLSTQAEYYQRYRICKAHLRSPALLVEDIPQRFCQQCGRFHPLQDFDGDKKNCRARLLQHNSRRRKVGTSAGIPPYANQGGDLRHVKSVGSHPEGRVSSDRIRKRKLTEGIHSHEDDDYIYGDDYSEEWKDEELHHDSYDDTNNGVPYITDRGINILQELANVAAIHQQQQMVAPTMVRSRPLSVVRSAPGLSHPGLSHPGHMEPGYPSEPLVQSHPGQVHAQSVPPHYPFNLSTHDGNGVPRQGPSSSLAGQTPTSHSVPGALVPWMLQPPLSSPAPAVVQQHQQDAASPPPGAIRTMLARHYSDPPSMPGTTQTSLSPSVSSAISNLERAIGRKIIQAFLQESGVVSPRNKAMPDGDDRVQRLMSSSAIDLIEQIVSLHVKSSGHSNAAQEIGGHAGSGRHVGGMIHPYPQKVMASPHLAATVPRSGYVHYVPPHPSMHPPAMTSGPTAPPRSAQQHPVQQQQRDAGPLNPFMRYRDSMMQYNAGAVEMGTAAPTSTDGMPLEGDAEAAEGLTALSRGIADAGPLQGNGGNEGDTSNQQYVETAMPQGNLAASPANIPPSVHDHGIPVTQKTQTVSDVEMKAAVSDTMAKYLTDPQSLDSFIKVLETLKSQSLVNGSAAVSVSGGGGGGGNK